MYYHTRVSFLLGVRVPGSAENVILEIYMVCAGSADEPPPPILPYDLDIIGVFTVNKSKRD
jgi:hypothetical protein